MLTWDFDNFWKSQTFCSEIFAIILRISEIFRMSGPNALHVTVSLRPSKPISGLKYNSVCNDAPWLMTLHIKGKACLRLTKFLFHTFILEPFKGKATLFICWMRWCAFLKALFWDSRQLLNKLDIEASCVG